MIPISKTPISQMCYQIALLLYIDDTDLPLHNKGNESVVEIVACAQSTVSTWHKDLKYTSGNIKISKSSWTLQAY